MLRKATEIMGYNISATDGEIGHVEDFYIDIDDHRIEDPHGNRQRDHGWNVRYMVVDTGFWIFGRKVLIAPEALGTPNWDHNIMPVDMTKEEIENSPEIPEGQPISRAYETELRGYYGWPIYWGAPVASPTTAPATMSPTTGRSFSHDAHMATNIETRSQLGPGQEPVPQEVTEALNSADRPPIQSLDSFRNFNIEAEDGSIGRVDDVFIDDADWKVRYLLIDTGQWLPGRKVLISPDWVEMVDLHDSKVHVKMTKEQIENSPEYDPSGPLGRDYEGALYNYYHHRTYW